MSSPLPAETVKMQPRAQATRHRFLAATLNSLAEKGYAATTTQEVCRRANASRGTLLHHFATREALIVEAVEYILEENLRQFQETMTRIADSQLTLRDIARTLWEEHWTSPTCYAWLELVMAARTDPALNPQVRLLSERWTEKFTAVFGQVMGQEPAGAYWLFFLTLNALSLETIHTTPERVNGFLEDLLAVVDTADRLSARYASRRPWPAQGPAENTDHEGKK
ncbi:MAG: TetR/AcrR family transcriptional regulator [Desulfosudaceae bacterium]